MKLKPIVASLVALGLVAPALAKGSASFQQEVTDQNSVVTSNCAQAWGHAISLGGTGSIAAVTGNHMPAGTFSGSDKNTDLYVNNFNLLASGYLSNWSKAVVNVAYLGAPKIWGVVQKSDEQGDTMVSRVINNYLGIDEAYVQLGDLAKYPVYVVVGKKYLPFGDYQDPYAPLQLMSPTQMMTQTNATTAIVGLSHESGFYGNLFAFRGVMYRDETSNDFIRNFGAKLGYHNSVTGVGSETLRYNVAASYMHNLWDTMVFNADVLPNCIWGSTSASNCKAGYTSLESGHIQSELVGGVSLHADVAYKPFTFSANWVTALKDMKATGNKSKIWAADVNAKVDFPTLSRDSSIALGAQYTGNYEWLDKTYDLAFVMPKWRFVGEYKLNVFKNTDLALTYAFGKSYNLFSSKRTSSTGFVRLNFCF